MFSEGARDSFILIRVLFTTALAAVSNTTSFSFHIYLTASMGNTGKHISPPTVFLSKHLILHLILQKCPYGFAN